MYRITCKPGAGSDGPRVFKSEDAPVDGIANGPGTDPVIKFIGYPVPRVMRLSPDEVLSIEVAADGEQWAPFAPETEEPEPEQEDDSSDAIEYEED